MKMFSARIEHFHSIEDVAITGMTGLNVLIGKNNSGKSNVLSAIVSFFRNLKDSIVATSPSVSQKIDFFKQDTSKPCRVTIALRLLAGEAQGFAAEVLAESPQASAAGVLLKKANAIELQVVFSPPPRAFAYVTQIRLLELDEAGAVVREHVILRVEEAAAQEIRDRVTVQEKAASDAEGLAAFLQGFDEDDFTSYRRETGSRAPLRYFLARFGGGREPSPEALEITGSLLKKSSSYPEFVTGIQSYIQEGRRDSEVASKERLKNGVRTFSGEDTLVPNYAKTILRTISAMKILYLSERRRPIGREEAERLLQLKVKRGGVEKLGRIQETVQALLGVRIDVFNSDSPRRGEQAAELDVDNFLVEANGSGVREALRLILDYEFERPSFLLVEEPEVHLHPGLETTMMRYLSKVADDCQVILTTHSTNFMDSAESKNVYFVSKQESTKIDALTADQAATLIPRELGIRLSSLFMYDRLVFVEGPTDEAILREFAATKSTSLTRANVGFVQMGGGRNFTHYAAQAVISFLSKRQVRMWFVLDRDEMEDADVARLQGFASGSTKIHILARRELENYLLSPTALAETIGDRNAAKPAPSAAEVAVAVDALAESLKAWAIEKRVVRTFMSSIRPLGPDVLDRARKTGIVALLKGDLKSAAAELEKRSETVSEVLQRHTAATERDWAHKKLMIAPGTEILEMLFAKYGARYPKDRDGPQIARRMPIGDIAEELTSLLGEITAAK